MFLISLGSSSDDFPVSVMSITAAKDSTTIPHVALLGGLSEEEHISPPTLLKLAVDLCSNYSRNSKGRQHSSTAATESEDEVNKKPLSSVSCSNFKRFSEPTEIIIYDIDFIWSIKYNLLISLTISETRKDIWGQCPLNGGLWFKIVVGFVQETSKNNVK